MTPISRVNRDIFHDIARRKGARASRHPFSPSLSLSFPLLSLSSTPRTILRIRRRWMKSFPSCYPRELSRRAPTTSRKFRDVNAIALRAAADRRPDFACSRVPVFLQIYRPVCPKLLRAFRRRETTFFYHIRVVYY